jgi:predicted dehydrogenase
MTSAARIRAGVIGAGPWGRNIIRAVRASPDFRLTAVASRNPETASWAGAQCVVEPDWRAFCRSGLVDAAIVATPPATHSEIVSALVTAGLPVLVEKPLTMDVGQAEGLVDVAMRTNGYVLVDHVHLFSPAWRMVKNLLPEIGAIKRIRGEAGARGPFRRDVPVLWDWGPHDAAFCLDALGSPPRSMRGRRIERQRIDAAWGEALLLEADHASGAAIEIRLSNLRDHKARNVTIEGERGSLIYDDRADHKLVRTRAGYAEPEPIKIASDLPLDCALAYFAEAVRSGGQGRSDLEFGVETVRMLEAWQHSL